MSVITNDDRREAMAAVYFHGYPELSDTLRAALPAELSEREAIALDTATETLVNDTGELASLRLRRAVVKLAAGRRLTEDPNQRLALTSALERLNAPLAEIDSLALSVEPPPVRWLYEAEVYKLLIKLAYSSACKSVTDAVVGYDMSTDSTVAWFRIITSRDFASVARILDPLNWSACSIYFESSYWAEEVGGNYPVDSDGNATKDTSPVIPGTSWSRVLFEHFQFNDLVGNKAFFRNLLNVQAERSADEFHYHYDLHTSINCGWGWLSYPKGLIKDEGFVSGRVVGGEVEVQGVKTLRTNFITDPIAQFFLRPMAEEMAEILCVCNP